MIDAWYFAGNGRTVGPLRLAELKTLLYPIANWEKLMVWRTGFSKWQTAGSVWEILELYETPSSDPTVANSDIENDPHRALKSSMPLKLLLGAFLLVTAAAVGALGLALVQSVPILPPPTSTTAVPSIESGISSALDKIRTGLPKRIDATTILTGVRSNKTEMIFENLITTDIAKFDDTTKDQLRLSVIKNVCGNVETRRILDVGGSFHYTYADMQTRPVFAIDVFKRSCP